MKRFSCVPLFLMLCLASFTLPCGMTPANGLTPATQDDGKPKRPNPEDIHEFEFQEIILGDFPSEGYVLAIGGGGEGVIGQLKGHSVIAIDINKRELDEAPPGPLKLVMDARDLKFVDSSFGATASFFTFMYISGSDHEQIFKEVFRVLRPGGSFRIWDVNFRERPDPTKKVAVFRYHATLPDKEIRSGYGVRWPDHIQDLDWYLKLAEKTGFTIEKKEDNGIWFSLVLVKPRN